MRNGWMLLLLIIAGMAGCIGDDGDLPFENETSEQVNCVEQNSVSDQERSLFPGQRFSGQAEVNAGPPQAHIRIEAQGAGTIDLVLTHGDDEVWQEQVAPADQPSFETRIGPLEPGAYTLTATTEDGAFRSVDMRLALSYSSGCQG